MASANRRLALRAVAAALAMAVALPAGAYSIFDLQAVDATGNPTDPMVKAPPDPANRVTVEGIVLNRPEDFSVIDPSVPGWQYWQIYVQSEEPGKPAGIAVFQGRFFAATWPPPYPVVQPGDRVEVNGFVADHRGKSNINTRHSAAPQMDFTVDVVGHPGMPVPVDIPSLAECTYFSDERRDEPGYRGGEFYQAQWCRLSGVRIIDPPADDPPWGGGWGWGAGKSVLVTDDSGEVLPLYLAAVGDFGDYFPPDGPFSVVGIFDQEDPGTDIGGGVTAYTGNYRLWVLQGADVFGSQEIPEPATLCLLGCGGLGLVLRRRRYRPSNEGS
ncbi:MAG: PEP-CTERM sorting domain-containing protein [Candidatus Brocadiia bacterium]